MPITKFNKLLLGLVSFCATFGPMYLVERIADFFFLTHNPTAFYSISGARIDLFIAIALAGSVAAGALLRDFRTAVATQGSAVMVFLSFVYEFCVPKVCYSAGPDGLEPLRMGVFLGSVAIAGVSVGVGARRRLPWSPGTAAAVAFGIFVALGFYPIIYTFAGARLLPGLYPWSLFIFLAILSYATAVVASLRVGPPLGFLIPVAATGFVMALSWGLATDYLPQIGPGLQALALGTLTGSSLGLATVLLRKGAVGRYETGFNRLLLVALLLVLLMIVVVTPDEVSGVFPGSFAGSASRLVIGSPAYVGAYMDTPAGHSTGVGVTVSFSGTNPDSIPRNNFLSGGMGVHSPDCCRDGIDYGYRFDVYLFHNGNESLAASAWQICDNNAACGGHSWKNLLFSKIGSLPAPCSVSTAVTLHIQWNGRVAYWSYQIGNGTLVTFASFSVPAKQDPFFNTGVLAGRYYFFQFGVMSRHPFASSGWSVAFSCPSTLVGAKWECVDHAGTLQGSQSYWKALWRWGESYPHTIETRSGEYSFELSYSKTSSVVSFQTLW